MGRESENFGKEIVVGLVILSSQGQDFLESLLVGSVAKRVVRLATYPVLLLRASSIASFESSEQ